MQDKSLFNEQIQNIKSVIYFKFDKSGHFFFSSICLTVTLEDWLKQHLEHLTYTGFVWDDDSLFQHNDLGVLEQFEAVVTLTHIAPIGVYTVMVTGVCSLTFINI